MLERDVNTEPLDKGLQQGDDIISIVICSAFCQNSICAKRERGVPPRGFRIFPIQC